MEKVFYLQLFSSGCDGEQQGGGSCRGGDGRRRRRGGQVVRRLRRSYRRPLPALLHGALLAHALPQVLMLPRTAGRVQQHLLQQRRHDPLQERLHQVRPNRLNWSHFWARVEAEKVYILGLVTVLKVQKFYLCNKYWFSKFPQVKTRLYSI